MNNEIFEQEEEFEVLLGQNYVKMSDALFQYMLYKWFSGERIVIPMKIDYPFGTKEWSNETFNSREGCRNFCRNCYARNLAKQKQFSFWDNYDKAVSNRKEKWIKTWRKKNDGFIFMYPSMHDTWEDTVDDAIAIMTNMLKANGNVLFVTKPQFEVIRALVEAFPKGQLKEIPEGTNGRIEIRMSISTDDDDEIAFWEENAPRYEERLNSLKLASKMGFVVSVSMEPFLLPKRAKEGDPIDNIIKHAKSLLPYTSNELWFGMMNYIPKQRSDGKYYLRKIELTAKELEKFKELEELYEFSKIFHLVSAFYKEPKIRWKESIKKVVIDYMRRFSVYNEEEIIARLGIDKEI